MSCSRKHQARRQTWLQYVVPCPAGMVCVCCRVVGSLLERTKVGNSADGRQASRQASRQPVHELLTSEHGAARGQHDPAIRSFSASCFCRYPCVCLHGPPLRLLAPAWPSNRTRCVTREGGASGRSRRPCQLVQPTKVRHLHAGGGGTLPCQVQRSCSRRAALQPPLQAAMLS